MAEVSGFANFIQFLTGADAFSLLFPFLLSWMLFLAAIEKANVFNNVESFDNAAPVMAMILAFFTARFLVMQPFYQSFFSIFFGKIVIGLVSILGLLTLASFTGFQWQSEDGNSDYREYIFYIAILMAGAAFVWAGGFGPALFGEGEIAGWIGVVASGLLESGFIWLLVIGGAMLWVMSSGNDNGVQNPVDDPDDDEDE